jgi:uncharacterized protein YcbX
MSEVIVSGLNKFPIKACGGIAVQEARIVETGLEDDHLFMLIDKKNRAITQRSCPELAMVKPSFGHYRESIEGSHNGNLIIDIDGVGSTEISMSLPPYHVDNKENRLFYGDNFIKQDLVEATILNTTAIGVVVSDDANKLFEEFFEMNGYEPKGARLIRAVKSNLRKIDPKRQVAGASPYAGFTDGYPLLLASEASNRELSAHPAVAKQFPDGIPMDRWRAGIHVKGDKLKGYDESYWQKLKIGNGLTAWAVKPCARCAAVQVDQETGEKSVAIKTALKETRTGKERGHEDEKEKYCFAENLIHQIRPGIIAVGDVVTVLKRSEESNFILASGK